MATSSLAHAQSRRSQRAVTSTVFFNTLLVVVDDLFTAIEAIRRHMMTSVRLTARRIGRKCRAFQGIVAASLATARPRYLAFLHCHSYSLRICPESLSFAKISKGFS